jgi:hypothetical protein
MAEIEFVTLANHAEALSGLLYLSGAGWNDVIVAFPQDGPSAPFHFGVGVSILVPWTETNRRQRLSVWLEHEDGGEPLLRIDGQLEVGRPPGAQEGADQRTVLAVNAITQFPKTGGYRLIARLNGDKTRTVSFRVRAEGDLLMRPQAS